jgi:hypothetical protein
VVTRRTSRGAVPLGRPAGGETAYGEALAGPTGARWDDRRKRSTWRDRRKTWPINRPGTAGGPTDGQTSGVRLPPASSGAEGDRERANLSVSARPPSPGTSPSLAVRNEGPGWAFDVTLEVRPDLAGHQDHEGQPYAPVSVTGLARLTSMSPGETTNCRLYTMWSDRIVRVTWTDGHGRHIEDRLVSGRQPKPLT